MSSRPSDASPLLKIGRHVGKFVGSNRSRSRQVLLAASIGLLASAHAAAAPLGFIMMRVYLPAGGTTSTANIVPPTLVFENVDGSSKTVLPCADQTAANAELLRAEAGKQTGCAWTLSYGVEGRRTMNMAAPDTAAVYWLTPFVPEASLKRIRIQGTFPNSRYMSFVTYNNQFNTWLPLSENPQVTDYEIIPDTGYMNPWQQPALPGGKFTIDVVRNHNANGYNPNLLPMPPANEGRLDQLLTVMPDPAANCSANAPCLPWNQFAKMPEEWVVGMAPNEDSGYLGSYNNFGRGYVQIIRAKLPAVTAGNSPEPWLYSGKDLRYVSLCTYPLVKPYPVGACLKDNQFKLDGNGYFTVVVGLPADKPGSVERRGHNWLPYASSNLVEHAVGLRNMVRQNGFNKAVHNVPDDGSAVSAQNVMQEFYPTTKVCTVASYQLLGANCRAR